MLSKFFIDRPVFAWVIAIGMMVLPAVLAIYNLPISQYPPDRTAVHRHRFVLSREHPPKPWKIPSPRSSNRKMTGLDKMLYISGDQFLFRPAHPALN